jgi:hypothetical protein
MTVKTVCLHVCSRIPVCSPNHFFMLASLSPALQALQWFFCIHNALRAFTHASTTLSKPLLGFSKPLLALSSLLLHSGSLYQHSHIHGLYTHFHSLYNNFIASIGSLGDSKCTLTAFPRLSTATAWKVLYESCSTVHHCFTTNSLYCHFHNLHKPLKQCCGSGSGIRCLFDSWIRSGSRRSKMTHQK